MATILPFKIMPQGTECECVCVCTRACAHTHRYSPSCSCPSVCLACLPHIPVWRVFHGMLLGILKYSIKRLDFKRDWDSHLGSATWLCKLRNSEFLFAYLWRIDLSDLKDFSSPQMPQFSIYCKRRWVKMVSPPHLSMVLLLFNMCQYWAFCRDWARQPFLVSSPTPPSLSNKVLRYGKTPHVGETEGPMLLLCFLWLHMDHRKQVGVTFLLWTLISFL